MLFKYLKEIHFVFLIQECVGFFVPGAAGRISRADVARFHFFFIFVANDVSRFHFFNFVASYHVV